MDTKKILKQVEQLSMRINTLADMQMLVMEELGNNNPEFQAKTIATILAQDKLREGFTEFVQTKEGVSDNIKVFMQDINEMIKDIKEEE